MAVPEVPTPELLKRLRAEVGIPAGEDDRLSMAIDYACGYVAPAIGDATVSLNVYIDCVVACAVDLYNMRNARLGVMDAGTDGVEPFRVPTDPLRAVWPKLNAVGILTGGSVIA